MKAAYTSLGFALGASAAVLTPRDQCCFGLTASGGVSGTVGQLSDGQNRIAQTSGLANQAGQYCLSNGVITDSNGRGCILTPPTTQFQCDVGATGTSGFSVSSNGELAYNGNNTFRACATGDNGGYNIYTTTTSDESNCVDITLSTGGKCSSGSSASASAPASSAKASSPAAAASSPKASSAPASSAPAAPGPVTETLYSTHYATVTSCGPEVTDCPAESTVVHSTVVPVTSAPAPTAPTSTTKASSAPAPSAPAASASGSACQTGLSGAYQTPHAVIPVNSNHPDQSYGTQYDAYIGGGNSTVFNFDIPSSYEGKQCTVLFLFPEKSQLETSDFTLSGSGSLTFEQLSSAVPLDVTYSSLPSGKSQLGKVETCTPGNSYVISSGSCAAGTTESIEVSASGDLSLEFFEDWNPSPIGVFITSC
ncbi:ubiquitin 3 binding protein But2 C-terminal domain-containing protein [Delphinella strobiligena]|nr:ubiquitin 3 binding protein But2 C-terminal domain-containing protein [Delphinella strobiligena]